VTAPTADTAPPVPRPIIVATAEPVTPRAGKKPSPRIRQGLRRMLIPFPIQRVRIAMTGSPTPRKAAFRTKSSIITTFPPSMMRA